MNDDEIRNLLELTMEDVRSALKRLHIIEQSLSTIQRAYVQHGERLTALERVAIFTPCPEDV